MKQTRWFYLLIVAAGLFSFGWPFVTDATAAKPNPCAEEIAKFCPEAAPGPAGWAATMDCLEKNEQKLSPECRDFEAGMGGPRMERGEAVRAKREFRQNCMGDMAKFCANAGPLPVSMMQCLAEYQSELSAPCKKSVEGLKR